MITIKQTRKGFHMTRHLSAFRTVTALLALVLVSACAPAPTAEKTGGLDGIWRTDGYGHVAEIDGDVGRLWEVTAISCVLGFDMGVGPSDSPDAEAVLTFEAIPGEEIQIDLIAGASPDEMWMQPRGTASRRRMIRIDALPSPCGEEREVDPLFVFDVFAPAIP